MSRALRVLGLFVALVATQNAVFALSDTGDGANHEETPTNLGNNVDEAFARADTDHNGLLDAKEFARFTDSVKKALDPFLSIYNGAVPTIEQAPRPRLRTGSTVNVFWSGFVSGILTIWATEVGDKTFFIAAILSMRKDRVVVFAGAISALIVMTVLSVVMGVVATKFLPPEITHYIGGVLFLVFGAKMLYDAREMSSGSPSEELVEVEEELMGKKADEDADHAEAGDRKEYKDGTDTMLKVFTQSFLMTFLAEWGDRSQIATVTLSATKDAFGVTLGAVLGHSMCTGLAVIGGKLLATRISERTVTLVGGGLFVLFALHSFLTGPAIR